MLEAEIIAHCAPTLAGIKTANMFTYTPMNRNKLSNVRRQIAVFDSFRSAFLKKMVFHMKLGFFLGILLMT